MLHVSHTRVLQVRCVGSLIVLASVLGFCSCASVSRVQPGADARTDVFLKAAERGSVGRVNELISEGVRIDAPDGNGLTALHLAADRGHDEMVKNLILKGASVAVKDKLGNTPLHLAALRGHDKTVRELLVGGAERSVKNNEGKTPAELAASNKIAALLRP